MNNIDSIDFSTFYFNGHYSDEMNVQVAGVNPLIFSAKPSSTEKTEIILGVAGVQTVSNQLNPRTFGFDILITDMSNFRQTVSWLSVLSEQDFYWKNDDIKIKCKLDSNQLDTTTIGYMYYQGQQNKVATLPLKFISSNPYFYSVLDKHYTFTQSATPLVTTTDGYNIAIAGSLSTSINFNNDGTELSFPLIRINGTGSVTIAINGQQMTMNNINGYVYIDHLTYSCYKVLTDLSTNMIQNYNDTWITLNAGINTVQVVSGTCTSVEVFCRSRYI